MKITPLPSIEEVEKKFHKEASNFPHAYIMEVIKEDRNEAYIRLLEGIENASFNNCNHIEDGTEYCNGYERACADIIENIVKPLYGKS